MSKLAEFLRAKESPPATPATPATNADESRKSRKSRSQADVDLEMQPPRTAVPARPPEPAERIVTCVDCLHFRARTSEQPDGYCRRFSAETWGAVEFSCDGFEHKDAAQRACEIRRAKVEGELRSHPEKRLAFDVAEAPLLAAPGTPVSVVLAVRHGEQIFSGDLHIPREKWDPWLFLQLLREQDERTPS